MSPKLISTLATAAVALVSAVAMSGAIAVEATQYNPEPGSQARAEVKADKHSTGVLQYGEATVFVDQPSTLSRALARSADSDSNVRVVRIGDATQFIDAPGVRSRAEVRAETLAAVGATRTQRR